MSRLQGTCKGDCSKCDLLANGEVDMMPCVMDQMFQRVQKNERMLAEILKLASKNKITLVGVEQNKEEDDGLQKDD